MYVVTSEEMRKIDQYAIETTGFPSMVLMENAGRNAAQEIAAYAGESRRSWAILIGKGNNGGDGIVAARHLLEWGFQPTLVYVQDPAECVNEAARQRDIADMIGIPSLVYSSEKIDWRRFDGGIDALLGTGSKGAPRGKYAELIREVNQSGLPLIAMDIPSGLNADTGQVHDPCIQAVKTTALAYTKRGLEQFPGKEAAGEIAVCSIGVLPSLAEKFHVKTFLVDSKDILTRFGIDIFHQERKEDTNKGTYGHVLVAAGTRQMAGAGLMCAAAALKTGAGLVSWAMPDRVLDAMLGKQPEVMLQGVKDQNRGDWSATKKEEVAALLEGKQTAVLGPGMGRWENDGDWLKYIWEETDCTLVLDADALNIIAEAGINSFPARSAPVILTPHPGEMARLTGQTVKEVQADRVETARTFAVTHQVTLVLKGARTVTAAPNGNVSINTTGNPHMATGGTGDVLAGMIASLSAQRMEAEAAAVCGVYLHGRAGDEAVMHSSRTISAWNVIEAI